MLRPVTLWPVAFKSTPDQADFTITNKKGEKIHTGTTPATVTLTSGAGYFSGETYNVTFGKNGYQDKTETIDTGINGWYWGNFLFGGVIGLLIIDPATVLVEITRELPCRPVGESQNIGRCLSLFQGFGINDIPLEARANLIPLK